MWLLCIDCILHAMLVMYNSYVFPSGTILQIQHPRVHLNRFDMVITPRHDYYPLTPHAQEQIPWFLRRWITPREPPDGHVVRTWVMEYFSSLIIIFVT